MNTKTKFALSIAAVFMMSGAAFADKVVQLGFAGTQGGPVSFIKRTSQTTSVAVSHNRHGIANSALSAQDRGQVVWHTTGPFGNSGGVTYSETR
jgi:hypothetical protein